MSVYSNNQIKQFMTENRIVCHPFRPEHLNSTSLDVTLGYYYFRVTEQNERSIYNIRSTEEAGQYFDGPYKALTHREWCDRFGISAIANIPLDHPVISLGPKERVIAHTHEFLGVVSPLGAELRARTSLSGNGITIQLGSSLLKANEVQRHTLELYNINEHETILLPVGERIGQVIFWHTSDTRHALTTATLELDLKAAIKIWSPDTLLGPTYTAGEPLPAKWPADGF